MNKNHNNSNIEIYYNLDSNSFINRYFNTKLTIIPMKTHFSITHFNYKKDDLVDVPLTLNNKLKYHHIYCNWFF